MFNNEFKRSEQLKEHRVQNLASAVTDIVRKRPLVGIVAATAAVALLANLLPSSETPVDSTMGSRSATVSPSQGNELAPAVIAVTPESSATPVMKESLGAVKDHLGTESRWSMTDANPPAAAGATQEPANTADSTAASVPSPMAADAAPAGSIGSKDAANGDVSDGKNVAAGSPPATPAKGKSDSAVVAANLAKAKAGDVKAAPVKAAEKTAAAGAKVGTAKTARATTGAPKSGAVKPEVKPDASKALASKAPAAEKAEPGKAGRSAEVAVKDKLPVQAQAAARPTTAVAPVAPVAVGARKAEYWSFWDRSQESGATINHGDWDRILRTYVVANHPSGINRFRYGGVSAADRGALKAYIGQLAAIDPRTFPRQEQKAYWLNLYNALTVNLVIEHYPVKSIRNIADKNLADGPWDSKLVTVADQKLSLNDIEHRILRPIWRDNKILFGLVSANLSCPSILPKAFTGKNSEELLKQSRRDFVNDTNRGVKLANGKLEASELFSLYQQDFAATDKNLIKFFAFNADDRKALYLLGYTGKIDFKAYDWALNAP